MFLQIKRCLLLLSFCIVQCAQAVVTDSDDLLDWTRSRYKAGEFSAVFASAQWMRYNSFDRLSAGRRDQWNAMELMALSRHCLWSDLHRIRVSQAPLGPISTGAVSYIKMKSGYKRFLSDPKLEDLSLTKRLLISRSRWRIDQSKLGKIGDPRRLRVEVQSKCEL